MNNFFLCGKQSPFGKRHLSQNSCHFRFWVKSFRLTLISITFLTLTLQILSISWSIITALHLFLTLICGIYCAFRYLFLSLTFCQMLIGLDRPSFFFSLFTVVRPTQIFGILEKKEASGVVKPFFTWNNSFNLKNEHSNSIKKNRNIFYSILYILLIQICEC